MALNCKEGRMCYEFDIDVAFKTRLGHKFCPLEFSKVFSIRLFGSQALRGLGSTQLCEN